MAFTIMMILNNSFKNGTFTCDKYVLNSYLYLILGIIFVALFVTVLTENKVQLFTKFMMKHRFLFPFLVFIGLVLSVVGLGLTDPTKVIQKHLFWILFIVLAGILFQPIHAIYIKAGLEKIIINSLIITFLLVTTLSLIAFYKPDFIKLSWAPVLFFALLGAILVEIVSMLTNSYSTRFNRLMNYIIIAIFIGYLLYDTKFMRERGKKCLETCDYYSIGRFDMGKSCVKPDYTRESVNLFLDIFNMFLRILSLNSR